VGILSEISHTQHIRQDTTGLGVKMCGFIYRCIFFFYQGFLWKKIL